MVNDSLTIEQAAEELGVAKTTVYRWLYSHKLKTEKPKDGERHIGKHKHLITWMEIERIRPLIKKGSGGPAHSTADLMATVMANHEILQRIDGRLASAPAAHTEPKSNALADDLWELILDYGSEVLKTKARKLMESAWNARAGELLGNS